MSYQYCWESPLRNSILTPFNACNTPDISVNFIFRKSFITGLVLNPNFKLFTMLYHELKSSEVG
jgi:hypothetical protein